MNRIQIGMGRWMVSVVLVVGMASILCAQQTKPAEAAPAVENAAPVEAEWSNPLPPGRLNLGVHFGEQQTESCGDIVAPVIQFKSGLLFVNPRGTWNDSDGQEFNLGLGYRQLFQDRSFIVGGNVFYDLRNTSLDNTFNQFGCGLEFLSTWVDARMNVYLPESGKKTADQYTTAMSKTQEQGSYWYAPTGQGNLITQYGYDVTSTYDVKTLQHFQISEQAMEGFDCEIGALLPIPVVKEHADVKAFAGFYDYNAHYGDDIAGMKGRLEIKPLPSLYLDAAWFEDKALFGSRYSVGARASIPFDLARLSKGKNPFAGALAGFWPGAGKPAFASRMTEMVVRDLHIRTDASEPGEVVADRRILERTLTGTDRKDYNLVLASGVTFVDDDNRSGVENGTWENPYRQISTGVQRAVGTMVYVCDAAQQYYENVVLREGLTLWGSGAPIYGQGNRFMGGVYPVVNGLGRGPVITLANGVTVAGIEITQQIPAYPPQQKGFAWNLAGIYGENVTDVSIHHNYIHGSGSTEEGVLLRSYGMESLVANIANNRIDDIRGTGIDVYSDNTSEVDLELVDNAVTRCDGEGVSIQSHGGDAFGLRMSGNYSGNRGDGIRMTCDNLQGSLLVDIADVTARNNEGHGIQVNLNSMSDIDASFSAIVSEHNGSGLRVDAASTWGRITMGADNVNASRNDDNGVAAVLAANGKIDMTCSGSTADRNGRNGFRVEATSYNGDVVLDMDGNTANENRGSGIRTLLQAGRKIDARFSDNQAGGNGKDGLRVDASAGGQMRLFGEWNVTKGNGDDGIEVKTTAASGAQNRQYDFGGGVLGSKGYNVMANNGDLDMERRGPGAFSAENNYWDGIVPPVYGREYTGNHLDVDNALVDDPSVP